MMSELSAAAANVMIDMAFPNKMAREAVVLLADTVLELRGRVARLESFARDVSMNWDCDEDAHKNGTKCRCCEAVCVLTEKME